MHHWSISKLFNSSLPYMQENKIEVIKIQVIFKSSYLSPFGAFFFNIPAHFLRVNGGCRRWKIANKTKETFKLAMEPKVWFRSWKYPCASCIKLKHCALATPPGLEVEFEVIPPPACHVWIGPTLMTNYWLTEHKPRAETHRCRGILPHWGGPEAPLLPFSSLSLDLEDWGGGTGKEDTLNSPFLDVAIARDGEVEHLSPCKEVTQHPAEVLTKCVVRGVLVAHSDFSEKWSASSDGASLWPLTWNDRSVSCAVQAVFATRNRVRDWSRLIWCKSRVPWMKSVLWLNTSLTKVFVLFYREHWLRFCR